MLILACLSAFDSGSLFACLCVSVRARARARTCKCPQRCTPVPRCVWCVYIRVSKSLGTYVHEPSSCFRVTWQLSLLCHCIIWPVCFYSCAHVSATWLCWFAWITSVFYGLTYTVCTIRVFVYPCTFSSFPEACWLVWSTANGKLPNSPGWQMGKAPIASDSTGLFTFNRKLILSFSAHFATYQCADANISLPLT